MQFYYENNQSMTLFIRYTWTDKVGFQIEWLSWFVSEL